LTVGYLTTWQEAELARETRNGHKLDRLHILAVNVFHDFDKYMKVPDEWTAAELTPYAPGVCHPNPQVHLFSAITC
jgi:hypothetical protein